MKVVCFGDSNTWGFIPDLGERHPRGVRWTSLMEEYTGAEVVEEGLSGRTCTVKDPYWPHATGSDYLDACVLTHVPFDLFICMLGTNDVKCYLNQSVEEIAERAASLCVRAKELAPDIKVLFISPIEVGTWRVDGELLEFPQESIEKTQKFAAEYEKQAKKHGFYFLDAAKFAKPAPSDAIHMTPEEHKKLAVAIADKVKEIQKELNL